MQFYVMSYVADTGAITGTGATADGTFPEGAIECTQEQTESPMSYLVQNSAVVAVPAPSAEDLAAQQAQVFQSACTAALQKTLDCLAQAWGYDSIVSAASYATSGNAQFAAEAKALVDWRDAVWLWGYEQLAAIQSGAAPLPASVDALIASVPAAPARPEMATQ